MPFVIVLLIVVAAVVASLIFLIIAVTESSTGATLAFIIAGMIAVAGILWMCDSWPLDKVEEGVYNILTKTDNGTEFQYIVTEDNTKLVNLYKEFGRSFPEGTKIRVYKYNLWKRGMYHPDQNDKRHYEPIEPKKEK